jgi:hypothetical protein
VAIVEMRSHWSTPSSANRERLRKSCTRDQSLSGSFAFIMFSDDTSKYFSANEGNRWRSPENPWKREPFLVTALPTIIKVTDDGVGLDPNI